MYFICLEAPLPGKSSFRVLYLTDIMFSASTITDFHIGTDCSNVLTSGQRSSHHVHIYDSLLYILTEDEVERAPCQFLSERGPWDTVIFGQMLARHPILLTPDAEAMVMEFCTFKNTCLLDVFVLGFVFSRPNIEGFSDNLMSLNS
jgi:hypothetical protein